MYPVLRLGTELLLHRTAPPLGLTETHVSHHVCWPWDIDPWGELNNGRTLTLYDLGRVVLFARLGVRPVFRQRRWGGAVAGASVRWRRRVHAFDRFELRSRLLGWDARFFYADQAMWRSGTCVSQGLMRMAITSTAGIVAPAEVTAALGHDGASPPLPAWVAAWIAAEAERPWPPARG